MRAKFIIENEFNRGIDPIDALNISIVNQIFASICKEYSDGGAYSFYNYEYKNWKDIIKYLLNKGYNQEEIESVLRSKLMRCASDNTTSNDHLATLEDFKNFNNNSYNDKSQVDYFLDSEFPDPSRSSRINHQIDEDAMGAPISTVTLTNTPGMGNAQPAAKASTGALSGASTGSGDNWDSSTGKIYKQAKSKKITEENINPYDSLGISMAKKMGVKPAFKKKKKAGNQNSMKQEKFESSLIPIDLFISKNLNSQNY